MRRSSVPWLVVLDGCDFFFLGRGDLKHGLFGALEWSRRAYSSTHSVGCMFREGRYVACNIATIVAGAQEDSSDRDHGGGGSHAF